ncbi:hypothetical protein CAI21_17405 [Alkalilimnicola ehrlichii]|uniref:Uncharacterized protein n=2 Tax=Alkalilimnicola ehrlichii TaxID=351052 RepID=A0A3E0WM65_9GAMM|nr:hypothetical protein CAI21_17405 [Alkalilimnicola ehrlichii]RFA33241.1 hypothetical protein CAL65_17890 [Alkalilimnicola ehrlichii]
MDEVRRSVPDQVFSIIFDVRPFDESADCVGAFALCWISADTLLEAERIAVARLFDDGWRPVRFEEYRLVSADSDKYGEEGYTAEEIDSVLANVAMAQKDGYYSVLYKYSSEDEEH